MSNPSIFPSYFGTPLTTDIPSSRYDSKGRQLSFVETEVQRLERMALVNASKSRSSSPAQSRKQPSSPVSPLCVYRYMNLTLHPFSQSRTKSIPDPYVPTDSTANYYFTDKYSDLSGEKMQTLDSILDIPTSHKPSSSPFNPKPGYKRKRSSLSSICEEN